MGVQMGRGYRSALQSHLCLILVSVLLMGKVSLWNQEAMVQFHMRVSGGAGLEPVSRPQAIFLLTAMPQADGPHWDLVFLSTHCVCSCVVCTYLTWQPLQLHAPHLAAPTICSSESSPGLLLGISLDLMMSPGGRRQGTQLDCPDVPNSSALSLLLTPPSLPYLFYYCVWNTTIMGGHPWILKSIPPSVVQSLNHVQLFCSPMDCTPTGSSVHGISQARMLDWVPIPILQGIFLDQGLNLRLLHWQVDSLPLSHQGSPSHL